MKFDRASEVQIILTGEALRNARREVCKSKAVEHGGGLRGYLKAWLDTRGFKGPRFKASHTNQISYAIGAATVNVGWAAFGRAGEYVYPLNTVGRIKVIAE